VHLLGQITCFVSLLVLSSVLLAGESWGQHNQGVVAVFAVLLFIFGYSVGPGVACWVILTELVPTAIRAKIYGLFVGVHWACTLLQGMLTLIAIDGIGGYRNSMDDDQRTEAQKRGVGRLHILFSFITLCGIAFVQHYVPETTGKSPEDGLLQQHGSDSSSHGSGVRRPESSASARQADPRAARGTFSDTL
jgi:MFS transporter, SP family, xylose:H+ symportor